jgi:hypothetical protein
MVDTLETDILRTIKENVDKFGETSIKSVAESFKFDKVSLSEQKKLAKLIVRENLFTTEIRNGEILVKINKQFDPAANFSNHEKLMKWFIATLAGVLIYIIFHVIVPRHY